MSLRASGTGPAITPTRVFRRRYTIEVTWTQPVDQEHIDDWGAVMTTALHEEASCLYDIEEDAVHELVPEGGDDGAS